jgi:hypothetical protein
MKMTDTGDAIIGRIERYHSDESKNAKKEMALSELNLLQERELLARNTVYSDELMRIALKRACENTVRAESHLSTVAEEAAMIERRIRIWLNIIGLLLLVVVAILAAPYAHLLNFFR